MADKDTDALPKELADIDIKYNVYGNTKKAVQRRRDMDLSMSDIKEQRLNIPIPPYLFYKTGPNGYYVRFLDDVTAEKIKPPGAGTAKSIEQIFGLSGSQGEEKIIAKYKYKLAYDMYVDSFEMKNLYKPKAKMGEDLANYLEAKNRHQDLEKQYFKAIEKYGPGSGITKAYKAELDITNKILEDKQKSDDVKNTILKNAGVFDNLLNTTLSSLYKK